MTYGELLLDIEQKLTSVGLTIESIHSIYFDDTDRKTSVLGVGDKIQEGFLSLTIKTELKD